MEEVALAAEISSKDLADNGEQAHDPDLQLLIFNDTPSLALELVTIEDTLDLIESSKGYRPLSYDRSEWQTSQHFNE